MPDLSGAAPTGLSGEEIQSDSLPLDASFILRLFGAGRNY